jgi:hypothetical protein
MNVPAYINKKGNIVRLVLLTALFALIFINIYQPFQSASWYNVSKFMFFVFSSIIILTGVLVVIISRLIMYFYTRKHPLSYLTYGIWVLCEILLMSLFYTIYTLVLKRGLDPVDVFKNSIINTSLVLLLPYGVLTLYFAWRDSKKRLELFENSDIQLQQPPKVISFRDEKGSLRLSVSVENLLYIESSDNYVIVHYVNLSKQNKYLLRNTLKNVENSLEGSPLIRCHRSYLVNLMRIRVMRKTKEGLVLEFDVENVPELPVSKSYETSVSSRYLK